MRIDTFQFLGICIIFGTFLKIVVKGIFKMTTTLPRNLAVKSLLGIAIISPFLKNPNILSFHPRRQHPRLHWWLSKCIQHFIRSWELIFYKTIIFNVPHIYIAAYASFSRSEVGHRAVAHETNIVFHLWLTQGDFLLTVVRPWSHYDISEAR